MRFIAPFTYVILIFVFISCKNVKESSTEVNIIEVSIPKKILHDTVIVDCNYSFEEAIEGTAAPIEIINQLQLIKVKYYSIDNKIHEGQLLTNKNIANDLAELFDFMLQIRFPIAKVIPIVKYNWNDNLSMQDNNTYSFCYRNLSYSKHAQGMAIDINPFFNPIRSKNDSIVSPNKPFGANYDPTVQGTFYAEHPVVIKFKDKGFKWGHYFKRKYDDHHFEK